MILQAVWGRPNDTPYIPELDDEPEDEPVPVTDKTPFTAEQRKASEVCVTLGREKFVITQVTPQDFEIHQDGALICSYNTPGLKFDVDWEWFGDGTEDERDSGCMETEDLALETPREFEELPELIRCGIGILLMEFELD